MKFTDQILFDLTDIDNETFKIQHPLDYEKDKKPLQHPRIKALKKQAHDQDNMQITNTSLSNQKSRQEILQKWKDKRKKLIFKRKKITCIKKSEYAKEFKKRGANGRFILIKK